MDRFKYRVWDKSAEQYVPRSQFILLSDGTLIQEIGGEEVIWESTQPEFCTGLKDKNGKLIYDGDYVRAINQDTKDRPDLQIGHIWVDELNCRWIKFSKEELSWNDFCSLIDYDATLEIEVIGNEHEERNFE